MSNKKKTTIQSKLKAMLAEGAMLLLVSINAAGCGKEPNKTSGEPTSIVTDVSPTGEAQQPTTAATPTEVSTPTPTPIVSTVKTTTKPFDEVCLNASVTGSQYNEIVSLGKEDILNYYRGDIALDEYDEVVNLETFATLVDNPMVSIDDLKLALDSNSRLSDGDKEIIVGIMKEIEAHGKMYTKQYILMPSGENKEELIELGDAKIPYDALVINLSDVKMVENTGSMSFDPYTCTFYYDSNMDRETALRYLVGYCATTAYVEIAGKKYLCTPSAYCFKTSADGSSKEIIELGERFKKALVQIIVSNSKGEKIKFEDPYYSEAVDTMIAFTSADKSHYTYIDYLKGGYKDLISKFTPDVFYSASGDDTVDLASLDGSWADQMSTEELINYYIGEPVNFISDNIDLLKTYGCYLPAIKNMCKTCDNTDTFGFSKCDYMELNVSMFTYITNGFEIDRSKTGWYKADDGTLIITDKTPISLAWAFDSYVEKYYAE